MTPLTLHPDTVASIDKLLCAAYPEGGPGAALLIVREGQALYNAACGLANLELNVRIHPGMVFRVGSITKQFTASSILLLMEEGRLKLDDPIEKYLIGYPTHGHTITIEHLLTHTSGIHSYTSMPEFEKINTRDQTPEEFINFFKNQPMDFAPGRRWNYSNSGYFLLGMIVEKITGQPFDAFLKERIFGPLGMEDTALDAPTRVIKGRVSGYQKGPDGWMNAPYLSMMLPYAAGSLITTLDDLAMWDAALYTGKILPLKTLQKAWTPYHLLDGSSTYYGYGWSIGEVAGSPSIEHGGGINGFTCHVLRLPEEQLFVALLSNYMGPGKYVEETTVRIAALALERPYPDITPVLLETAVLENLLGIYKKDESETWTFLLDEGKPVMQFGPDYRMKFVPISETEFAAEPNILLHLRFTLDEHGCPTSVQFFDRSMPRDIAVRV